MTLAILCSGQGSQHAEMFALTENEPAAAIVFQTATRLLDGRDPRALVRDHTADLHGNRVGQILCCTQALAANAALREHWGERLIVAGYSVGELASWGCAGVIDADDVLALARDRASAMDQASGGDDGLAFVRGLDRTTVDEICRDHDAAVAIANPGDSFVVGGGRDRLGRLCAAARERGASNSGLLKVAVASHTSRLAHAVEPFRAALREVATKQIDPRCRLLSGIDAGQVRSVEAGLDKLARQLAQTIQWADCLDACHEAGMTAALELGPGHALAGMVSATYPEVNARGLDDFRTLDGVRAWLRNAVSR